MPECHSFYPNCLWAVPAIWSDFALDTVLFTKVYGNSSTQIVPVNFLSVTQHKSQPNFTRKHIIPVTFDSPTNLYGRLC